MAWHHAWSIRRTGIAADRHGMPQHQITTMERLIVGGELLEAIIGYGLIRIGSGGKQL